jgi:hypothetical protein
VRQAEAMARLPLSRTPPARGKVLGGLVREVREAPDEAQERQERNA